MRLVFGLVLLVGIGLAGFAVKLVYDHNAQQQAVLEEQRRTQASIVPTQPVFVVTRDIGYGELLTREDVRVIMWPEESIPGEAFRIVDGENDLFGDSEEMRTVLLDMVEGEPVLPAKVTAPGEDAGLVARLTPGYRAFTIPVDATSGVSGFLRPGDHVDVYWSGRIEGRTETGSSGEVTRLIESNVKIVAVDQDDAGGDRSGARIAQTVTVEGPPQTVAALTQGQNTGRLTLTLVGLFDDSVAESVEIDTDTLLGIQAAPEPQEVAEVEPECERTVGVRRGAEIVQQGNSCND